MLRNYKVGFVHPLCWSMLRLSGTHTRRKTLPRSKQSRGERHVSSSTGLGTPQVSTSGSAGGGWAGLRGWSNDATDSTDLSVDCRCSTKNPEWPCTLPHPESQTGPPPITSTTHPCDKQLTLLTTRTHYRGSSFLPKTTVTEGLETRYP